MRLSGWSASEWLHNRKSAAATEKLLTYMAVGIIAEAVAIAVLAVFTALNYRKARAIQKRLQKP